MIPKLSQLGFYPNKLFDEKIEESKPNKKYTGFKVVGYDAEKKRAFSLYNTRLTYKNVKKGKVEKTDKGLYLGTTRDFSVDYYSGQTDYDDLLLTCEYYSDDIIKGDPTSRSGEVVVKQYKIIKIEFLENEYK